MLLLLFIFSFFVFVVVADHNANKTRSWCRKLFSNYGHATRSLRSMYKESKKARTHKPSAKKNKRKHLHTTFAMYIHIIYTYVWYVRSLLMCGFVVLSLGVANIKCCRAARSRVLARRRCVLTLSCTFI